MILREAAPGKNSRKVYSQQDNNPTKIYVEPTTNCNLTCTTCLRNTWDDESGGKMSMGTFKNLLAGISEINSLEKVAFWGIGEPLTHPQIAEMISMTKKLGVSTELITNAMCLDAQTAEKLIHAGLDELVVSVDSTSHGQLSEIRTGATLDDIIENITKLNQIKLLQNKSNPEIGVEFTVMKRNISELKNLKELAYTLGASFIIVTNVLPYAEDHKDEILYAISATEKFKKPRSRRNPEINLPRMDMRSDIIDDMGKISFEALTLGSQPSVSRSYNSVCPFVEQGSFAINWKGDLSPCVPLMHSYTCYVLGREKRIVKHFFGNINDESPTEIWNKLEYISFRDKVLNSGFSPCIDCGGCDMNESNLEDCFGNTHPTCGDCLWARGVIQCP